MSYNIIIQTQRTHNKTQSIETQEHKNTKIRSLNKWNVVIQLFTCHSDLSRSEPWSRLQTNAC